MAQGTFDVLHPGHIHYLEKSAEKGDELVVVIARDARVEDRKDLFFDEEERKLMVDSLQIVDEAILGSEDDIYSTVREADPDIITLGYDQHHSREKVEKMAEEATGHKVEVLRIEREDDYSSSDIKNSKKDL